jgi:hypothetical protein
MKYLKFYEDNDKEKNTTFFTPLNIIRIKRATISFCIVIAASYTVLSLITMTSLPYIESIPNAFSSIAYGLIDTPMQIRYSLFILSIVSFNLWAYPNPIINFIDVTGIFWVIIIVTISILPNANYSQKMLFIVNFCISLYITTIISLGKVPVVLYYYKENLVVITGLIYVLCGTIMMSFYIGNKKFQVSILCISVGFIFKILTIFADVYSGTCIFHLLTAIGIGILLQLSFVNDNEAVKLQPTTNII